MLTLVDTWKLCDSEIPTKFRESSSSHSPFWELRWAFHPPPISLNSPWMPIGTKPCGGTTALNHSGSGIGLLQSNLRGETVRLDKLKLSIWFVWFVVCCTFIQNVIHRFSMFYCFLTCIWGEDSMWLIFNWVETTQLYSSGRPFSERMSRAGKIVLLSIWKTSSFMVGVPVFFSC